MRTVVLLVTLIALAEATFAQAQGTPAPESAPGWWFVPSLRTSVVHEDNLLFTGETRAEGSFLRVMPTLETRFRSPKRSFDAAYSFDGERHSERLSVLNDLMARQSGGVIVRSKLGTRTEISATSRYIVTRRPEEVLAETGLVSGQRRTSSYSGDAALQRNVAPQLRARVGYSLAFEDFGPPLVTRPSARTMMQAGVASLAMERDARSTLGFEYTGRVLVGEDLATRTTVRGTFGAHVLAIRYTWSVTPRTTLGLLGGPRLSQELPETAVRPGTTALNWKARPELLASLTYVRDESRVAMSYLRSQFLGFGASGFIDTESLELRAAYLAHERLRLSTRTAVFRNSLVAVQAHSYRVDAAAAYQIGRWLSVDLAYLYKRQDRPLALADLEAGAVALPERIRPRTRNSFVIGVTVRRAIHVE